jgi:hypothetical protein
MVAPISHSLIMETIARYLILAGVVLILVGAGIYLAVKFGLPLGRLPGDIRIDRESVSFYFPLASSIVISIFLTVILNLIFRLLKK